MTNRELFREIMFYGKFDRMPVVHWHGWNETMERWYKEGLDPKANIHELLGTKPHWAWIGAHLDLLPWFPEEVLKETDEYRIKRGGDGVVQQEWKNKSCIPHYVDFTLKTAADWPEYKKRLQPDPARINPKLDEWIDNAAKSGLPIAIGSSSLMGWLRNWMGVEGMSYLMYEDRDCYSNMVMTIADLTCWSFDQILPRAKARGVVPDMAFGWEDICGKSGPLVSPNIFKECVAPGYLKIRNKLEEHGVKLNGIDSDGDVALLLKPWLDAGVNVQFPIEVGTWHADGMAYRKKYGKELRIIGHFDKLALERGHAAVLAEFDRLKPLMKDGGYMMMPDHLITPGVSWKDYRWFINQWKKLRF